MAASTTQEEENLPGSDILTWTFGNESYNQNKAIYIDTANSERKLCAEDARTIVRKLIAGFKAFGLKPGDAVCVHSFLDIYYPMLYFGIIGAGGQFTGSNPGYKVYELSHCIVLSKAKFIITEPSMLATVLEASKQNNIPVANIIVYDEIDKHPYVGCMSWTCLLEHGESDWKKLSAEEAKTTTAQLSFTSGTTGLPKAAMISHFFCTIESWQLTRPVDKPYDTRRLIALPPFHAFTIPLLMSVTIRSGTPAYLMRRFNAGDFCKVVEKFAITDLCIVPPMLQSILDTPHAKQKSLTSLRWVQISAAPLNSRLQNEFRDLLHPKAKVTQAWGMTECGRKTHFGWPEDDSTGSIGKPMPMCQLKIINEAGDRIISDNTHGEMHVTGPNIMLGYLENPVETAAAFDAEGWLRTGDIGYQANGKWYIDLIKIRGWQVSPAELESVLLTHPLIMDAAVISIHVTLSNGTDGELPRAYVVLKDSETFNYDDGELKVNNDYGNLANLTENDVKLFMSARLSQYKDLTGGVRFIEQIPRSATGKTLKNVLRGMASEEVPEALAQDPKTT